MLSAMDSKAEQCVDSDGPTSHDDICDAKSFFEEASECSRLVAECIGGQGTDSAANRLVAIFDKYQEQPNLLDPHLETITSPIILHLRAMILERRELKHSNHLFRVLYVLTKVRGYKTISTTHLHFY